MSGLVKDIYTKCAECGGTARLKFDLSFEPWRYVAVCNNCTQRGAPCVTQTQAIEDWDRRQKEKMAEKKKHKYCVMVEGREYDTYTKTEEYDNLEDAIKRAANWLSMIQGDKRIMVIEVIAKSQTTRQLVFTGDDEC